MMACTVFFWLRLPSIAEKYKTALVITAGQGIGTASLLAMVKKITLLLGMYRKCLNNRAGAHN